MVGDNGMILEGRGSDIIAATAKGMNDISISIGFIGTFIDNLPSRAALKTAKNFLQQLAATSM